jgi:6-phosphogluconolactonase
MTDIGGFIVFIEPDPKGRFLFTSESASSSFGVPMGRSGIGALTINRSSGALTPVPNGSVILNQPGQKIAIDPAGTHLYTVVGGSIAVYSIDQAAGALSLGSASTASSTIASLVILSPDGRFLFNVGNGSATTYRVNPSTGSPTATTFTVSTGATNEKDVAISPNGKYLYIIDASTTTKVVGINTDGSLTSLSPSPKMTGRSVSVAVSPNSNFVYVVTASNTGTSASLELFQVDSSGTLTSVSGSPFAQNTNPFFVTLDASGRFLYLASQAGLITFLTNSTTGALTQLSTASGSINNSQIIATTP